MTLCSYWFLYTCKTRTYLSDQHSIPFLNSETELFHEGNRGTGEGTIDVQVVHPPSTCAPPLLPPTPPSGRSICKYLRVLRGPRVISTCGVLTAARPVSTFLLTGHPKPLLLLPFSPVSAEMNSWPSSASSSSPLSCGAESVG